jgi:hypothetical protein
MKTTPDNQKNFEAFTAAREKVLIEEIRSRIG